MDFQTSLNRIEELLSDHVSGPVGAVGRNALDCRAGYRYQRRLTLMRRRQEAIQDELSRMATLADPRREQLAGDLALLEAISSGLKRPGSPPRRAPRPAPRPVRVVALRRMGVEQDA